MNLLSMTDSQAPDKQNPNRPRTVTWRLETLGRGLSFSSDGQARTYRCGPPVATDRRMLGSLTPAEIEDLLSTEVVARLGCHSEGLTYVVPVTYVYDGEGLLVQSLDGLKVRMMHRNPTVCVEVDHVDNLANWRSVIAWGRFEELFEPDATAAFGRLRERLHALIVSETTPAGTLRAGEAPVRSGNGHASIYRIRLFEKTGRFERR